MNAADSFGQKLPSLALQMGNKAVTKLLRGIGAQARVLDG